MPDTTPGGLYGKARRERVRNRASRLYAQQLVDEYLEPDWVEPKVKRFVPIRSRNEFVSETAAMAVTIAAWDADVSEPASTEPRFRRVQCATRPLPTAQVREETPETPAVLRIKPQRHAVAAEPREVPTDDTKRPYTFGGFLLGCAMGSAAAVMMLMVAQAVVR